MKTTLLSAASFLAISLCVTSCASNGDDRFPEESGADLQRTLDEAVASGVAPGVAISVRHPAYGEWSGAAGVADTASGTALTPAKRFRAGSMLKMLVAVTVLTLVEDGACTLDDTLAELLPTDIAPRIPHAEDITVRMLLNHTSGIPDFTNGDFDQQVLEAPTRIWTLDEILERAVAQEPAFLPGAGWSYSNTNYILLGESISSKTGMPWRNAIRNRVLLRAGLDDTSLPEEGNSACTRCARGYQEVADAMIDVTEVDPSMAGASGGHALITTVRDLTKFLSALHDGLFFRNPATLSLMLDFTEVDVPEEAQTGYGLGLARFQVGDVELVGHLGGTAGYQGFALLHPESGTVVSGYVNLFGNLGDFILPVLDAVARIP